MEQSQEELSDTACYEKHYMYFKKKETEMKEKVQDKFKEWRKSLRAIEMQVLDNLHVNYI